MAYPSPLTTPTSLSPPSPFRTRHPHYPLPTPPPKSPHQPVSSLTLSAPTPALPPSQYTTTHTSLSHLHSTPLLILHSTAYAAPIPPHHPHYWTSTSLPPPSSIISCRSHFPQPFQPIPPSASSTLTIRPHCPPAHLTTTINQFIPTLTTLSTVSPAYPHHHHQLYQFSLQ